jgi:hypothetical protein
MSGIHIDLTRRDIYDGFVIPDEHVEIAMKVLRTLQAMCLDQPFDVEGAQAMSAAYGWIHSGIQRLVDEEEAREAGDVRNDSPTADVLPTTTVQPDEGIVVGRGGAKGRGVIGW